jgi:hypothetical protein
LIPPRIEVNLRFMKMNAPSRKLLKFAAYASLGPITGPCVAGMVRHREKDPVLSAMYGVLLVITWLELPILCSRAIAFLQHVN